jgi:UPF0176 protein
MHTGQLEISSIRTMTQKYRAIGLSGQMEKLVDITEERKIRSKSCNRKKLFRDCLEYMNHEKYKIILFYKFVDIEDLQKLKYEQKELCERLNLKGRILIAPEGINGTFEGTVENIELYKNSLRRNNLFADIVFKESDGNGYSFPNLKIRVRNEAVTLGAGKFDVKNETAQEMTPEELDELYQKDEDFVILDLRNEYEIKTGHFDKTISPQLQNFRDLPKKISQLESLKKKKVIAVCTGGIRCEKATCLLQREGFENLYQLKDGIHAYMQKYPGKNFKGTLFVFDNRMVTPIIDTKNREIIGECIYCHAKSEDFYNDDSFIPSRKLICCQSCALREGTKIRKAGIN